MTNSSGCVTVLREVFGPILPIVPVDDIDEVMEIVNSEYVLATPVVTKLHRLTL